MAPPTFTLGMGMDPTLFLVLLLGIEEVAGGRYSLPLLFFSAHSLALALAFTATLLNPLRPFGTLALMALLPGVGSDARVRIQNGQV